MANQVVIPVKTELKNKEEKTMKKSKVLSMLALVLSIVMLVSILAGCGSQDNNQSSQSSSQSSSQPVSTETGTPAEKVTIQWWTPNWDEPESRQMVTEFEGTNSNIKVDLVITDWDTYKSKVTTAISANNAPELSTVLTTDVAPFTKLGLAAPLNDYAAKENIDLADFIKPALDIATVDGKIYGLPFRHDGSGMYYNVDLLKNAGYNEFPKTWDEFVAMSEKLTKDGVYGFAWPLGNQANAVTRLIQQLYTLNGDILSADETKCLLDSDVAKKALGNIVNSIKEGYASPNSLEWDNTKMRDAFGSGQLAVLFSGPFDIDTLKKDYPNLNFKTAVIPGINGMGCTTSNGWTVMMAEKSTNKDAAAKFLAYIIKPENQIRLTDSFPASKTAIKDAKFSTEYLAPFAEQLNNSRPEPAYKAWAEMEPIIYSYIQQAVSGSTSIDEACANMTKDINAILK